MKYNVEVTFHDWQPASSAEFGKLAERVEGQFQGFATSDILVIKRGSNTVITMTRMDDSVRGVIITLPLSISMSMTSDARDCDPDITISVQSQG